MNIASALYCVVIHRYTECYTSVIHGVIHPLLYAPVYSVSIRSVILTRITCITHVIQYSITMPFTL